MLDLLELVRRNETGPTNRLDLNNVDVSKMELEEFEKELIRVRSRSSSTLFKIKIKKDKVAKLISLNSIFHDLLSFLIFFLSFEYLLIS